jgi:hypothetical protein
VTQPVVSAGTGALNIVGGDYGEYTPGEINEFDKAIRHMPIVVVRLEAAGRHVLELVGPHFDMVTVDSEERSRARVYVFPNDNEGIHLELSEGVLIKAGLQMEGWGP